MRKYPSYLYGVRDQLERDEMEERMNVSVSNRQRLRVCVWSFGIVIAHFPGMILANVKLSEIRTPADARRVGLDSLRVAVIRDGGVPQPLNLSEFIKDRQAALQLGKALFWDMQVGSDGVQACASCHFHAGADNRSRNALNPALRIITDERGDDVVGYCSASFANAAFRFETKPPNSSLTREDFPLIKSIQRFKRTDAGIIEPVLSNSNDVVGSMGTFFAQFAGITPGFAVDRSTPLSDTVFNVHGMNSRRVEPRNTPTVINAVFNLTNFWDGRASPIFNGIGVFGFHDRFAQTLVNLPDRGLFADRIALDLSSLASQALQPPRSPNEMSFNGRNFQEIGFKLLRPSAQSGKPLVPLGMQEVDRNDSVLGALINVKGRGLSTTYEALIRQAFVDKYWNSTRPIRVSGLATTESLTQMEFNFSLFFGLAVQLYESTLVSDRSPFDRWMETGRLSLGFGLRELAGLNIFVGRGECSGCHAGPEFTTASVRNSSGGRIVRAMRMADGVALYDNGFYNTSVTPTTDDAGRGDVNINDQPLASARQALFSRLGIDTIEFPILGGDTIPARNEDTGARVCNDVDTNGFCDPLEAIFPEYRRVAVDGAFKTPTLRNAELTGPYFHNGGVATLRQVVQFYNRGGNFCQFNARDLDPSIKPLGLSTREEEDLVAFLVSLTDPRVKFQRAPFDHPELRIPDDGLDTSGTRLVRAVGAHGTLLPLQPFLELDPQDAIFTPAGLCRTVAR